MDFLVRRTQQEDTEAIGPLMRSVWLQTYKHILTEDELLNQSYKVHQPELIAAELGNIDIYSFVAEVNGVVVGHARGDRRQGNVVYVARLYLEPRYHGHGIGARLLQSVEEAFADVSEVRLDVYEDNKKGLNFYLSRGYEIVERTVETQSRGKDVFAFRMQKTVSLMDPNESTS